MNSLWPPVWTEKYGVTRLTGEIGTLTHLGNDARRVTLYLHITHKGLPYWGPLAIKDSAFRSAVYELLRGHIGHTISEIGDLDTSHML